MKRPGMIDVVAVDEVFDSISLPSAELPTVMPSVDSFAVPYRQLPEAFLENYADRSDHDEALLTDGFRFNPSQTFWREFLELYFPVSIQAGVSIDVSKLRELGNYFVPFGDGRKNFDRERWKAGRHDSELRRQLVQELSYASGLDWEELLGAPIDQPARSIFDGQVPEDHLGQPGQIEIPLFRNPPDPSGEYARAKAIIDGLQLPGSGALKAIRDTFETFHRGSQFPFRGE